LPLLALPELNTNMPLLPTSPALVLRIAIVPLDVEDPSPLETLTAPPVSEVLRPASNCIEPPAPHVPLPTLIDKIPPRPPVAAPEPRLIAPLLPLLALPELNTSKPLLPATPAFELRIETAPLDVAVPSPLDKNIAPPEYVVLLPEAA